MRKIAKYISVSLIAVCAVMATSCINETEDLFDTNASERMAAKIASSDHILRSAEYGWRVDYKPKRGNLMSFVMRFYDTDSVEMYSNLEETSKSTYNINSSEGPVLTFDSYGLIHKYADPSIGDNKGFGDGGDFEFIIVRADANRIEFRGRKNQDEVVFTKAVVGERNKIRLMRFLDYSYGDDINFFHVIKAGIGYADVKKGIDEFHLSIIAGNADRKEIQIAYDKNGFTLETPLTIGGTRLTDFTWNTKTKKFENSELATIEGANEPTYSEGAAVEKLNGKHFDIVGGSKTILKMFSNVADKFERYRLSQCYFNMNDTLSNPRSLFAFVLTKTDTLRWNSIYVAETRVIREDKVVFVEGLRDGDDVNEIARNASGREIVKTFFDPKGVTIQEFNNQLYLISITNSKKWLVLEVGIEKNPLFFGSNK